MDSVDQDPRRRLMARLQLDHDPIVLTPQRSRLHLSDLIQVGVAHGFDQLDEYDHVVPASVWRFDREVDLDREIHPSGESLVRPEFELALGTTSTVAHCRLPGFLATESCYPAPRGEPVTHFRHRFVSLWVSAEGEFLRLAIKPHFMPEVLVYVPTVTDGDPLTSPASQRLELPPEEWTSFVLHRFDQTIVSFTVKNKTFDVDAAGFRPSRVSHRYARVRRGIV